MRPDLEDIKSGAGVETRLLEGCVQDSGFTALVGGERGGEVQLETLGDEVVKLDLVAEDVGGGPGLGEGETVDLVGPFTLDVTMDSIGLGIAGSLDLEGDVGGGLGLDLERGAVEVVVPAEQVVGGLAKILMKTSEWSRKYDKKEKKRDTFQEGGTGCGRDMLGVLEQER
jgi:hypothetical protein